MAAPKTTKWMLDEHTRAKHAILKRYLDAWIPILSHGGFPRIVFVDGYAGPGIYEDGSDGSPIIALKAYLAQAASIDAEMRFHFVEVDRERAAVLQQTIQDVLANAPPCPRLTIEVHAGRGFEDVYDEAIHPTVGPKVPVFAFIDPFGWKISMATIARIMGLGRSEVLVNFMFEEINRFLTHPDQVANFDALFGGIEWRALDRMEGKARRDAIRDLFAARLKSKGGASYVRHFEMKNRRSQTDYYLYFATRSRKGLSKMKEAMWKADPAGAFTFSDATDPLQMVMFGNEVDSNRLEREICRRFAGTTCDVSEVEAFVLDETAFRETHYKGILKDLEHGGRLAVVAPKPTRRRGTFPAGTLIRFSAQAHAETESSNELVVALVGTDDLPVEEAHLRKEDLRYP